MCDIQDVLALKILGNRRKVLRCPLPKEAFIRTVYPLNFLVLKCLKHALPQLKRLT